MYWNCHQVLGFDIQSSLLGKSNKYVYIYYNGTLLCLYIMFINLLFSVCYQFRILAIANHAQGNMPYVKWGLPTKALDATSVRDIEGNNAIKVFFDVSIFLMKDLNK